MVVGVWCWCQLLLVPGSIQQEERDGIVYIFTGKRGRSRINVIEIVIVTPKFNSMFEFNCMMNEWQALQYVVRME